MAGSKHYEHQVNSYGPKKLPELSQAGLSLLTAQAAGEAAVKKSINILKENNIQGF